MTLNEPAIGWLLEHLTSVSVSVSECKKKTVLHVIKYKVSNSHQIQMELFVIQDFQVTEGWNPGGGLLS